MSTTDTLATDTTEKVSSEIETDALNQMVARAMGWRVEEAPSLIYPPFVLRNANDNPVFSFKTQAEAWENIPDFCNDWARAGEVVAWLNRKGYRVSDAKQPGAPVLEHQINPVWFVMIVAVHGTGLWGDRGETFPLALCRAVKALLEARGDSFAVPGPEITGGNRQEETT